MTRTAFTALNAALFATILAGSSLTPARASEGANEASELTALRASKITAQEAANAALAKTPGKVSSVQISESPDKPSFHVEIVGDDGKRQDLSVDAMTGLVTEATDQERGNDNEDAD